MSACCELMRARYRQYSIALIEWNGVNKESFLNNHRNSTGECAKRPKHINNLCAILEIGTPLLTVRANPRSPYGIQIHHILPKVLGRTLSDAVYAIRGGA